METQTPKQNLRSRLGLGRRSPGASDPRPEGALPRRVRFDLVYLIVAVLAVYWIHAVVERYGSVEVVSYSEFQHALEEGRVAEVAVDEQMLEGKLKSPLAQGQDRIVAIRVDPATAEILDRYAVPYRAVQESRWVQQVASWVVPPLLFFGLWVFVLRRMAARQGLSGGLLGIGRSKAKVYVETDTKVTFADVAGVDEAKRELQEIVDFLKNPSEYGRLGARLPRGVLLVGPPGTGKTLLARAVAGEAGVPFFSISGSEFVEMFVGVGAARVRDLFQHAREKAPAIIFIDELDALGRARGLSMLGGHDEKEHTLNQLLAELDGFDPRTGLVLLAATNRPEILDPALLRAGRFDRQVLVDRPDRAGRIQILQVHLRKVKLAGDVDPDQIAALTPGFSGADLANLVNEAALLATRRKSAESVGMDDFTQAIERIVAGLEKKNRLLNPREREIVSYHELGHAFVALAVDPTQVVQKVSIIPRGIGALGYTIRRPTEDRYLMTRQELENRMAVLLGGRAAELTVFGVTSTGSADDLAKATEIARSMVLRYGMDAALGPGAWEQEPSAFLEVPGAAPPRRRFSEATARQADEAIRRLLGEALERAEGILRGHRAELDRAAARLLEKETLLETEVRALAGAVIGSPPEA